MSAKADLRKLMIDKRLALSDDERAALCGYVCDKLVAIPLAHHSIVAGYKTIRGEVDILQALLACHDKKFQVCLPTVTPPQRIMHFAEWRPKMPMRKGPLGILEPEGSKEAVPTVVWVPLVAFDRAGRRLGYGGGYYDATLAHLKKTHREILTVGVAFSFQEVPELPEDPHDMKLDFIVTDREVIKI